jgi:hypothetical protein
MERPAQHEKKKKWNKKKKCIFESRGIGGAAPEKKAEDE